MQVLTITYIYQKVNINIIYYSYTLTIYYYITDHMKNTNTIYKTTTR